MYKTTVVYIPPRCSKARVEVFNAHIDKVNSIRSRAYIPKGSKILEMGWGDSFYEKWKKKYSKKSSKK